MSLNDLSYNSYMEYKFMSLELKLQNLIRTKYLKMLGEFIETMYPGLRFDIFIRERNPKERRCEWYGYTYMELIIFDIIFLPEYTPNTFNLHYRVSNFDGHISYENIYNDINSYIPEINKHLLISFVPLVTPDMIMIDKYNLEPYECWKEHFHREYVRDEFWSSNHWG